MTMIAIHGDKQQNERDWVLNEFKTGKSPIMVATDVASRGIGMIDTVLHSILPLYPVSSSATSKVCPEMMPYSLRPCAFLGMDGPPL